MCQFYVRNITGRNAEIKRANQIPSTTWQKNNFAERRGNRAEGGIWWSVRASRQKSYIISTVRCRMFNEHQTQRASGIEHQRPGADRSDTWGDRVSTRRRLGRNRRLQRRHNCHINNIFLQQATKTTGIPGMTQLSAQRGKLIIEDMLLLAAQTHACPYLPCAVVVDNNCQDEDGHGSMLGLKDRRIVSHQLTRAAVRRQDDPNVCLSDSHWHVVVRQHGQEVLVAVVFDQISLTWLQRKMESAVIYIKCSLNNVFPNVHTIYAQYLCSTLFHKNKYANYKIAATGDDHKKWLH